MGKLNKKIVVRLTKRQLEYLVEETTKENITISQVVRKALTEHLIKGVDFLFRVLVRLQLL